MKGSNQKYGIKTFIADSGTISHMVNTEEIITNLHNAETRVTVGYSRNLNGKTGNWRGYQKRDKKLHHVMLFDTDIMTGLHTSLFIVTLELHKVFQATTEVEALILKKYHQNSL